MLIRLKSHRTRSRVPVRTHRRGAPPTDGPLVQGTRPETPGTADDVCCQESASGGKVAISRWNHRHVQHDRPRDRSVIKLEREAARGSTRDPRVSGFVMLDAVVPLSQVAASSARHFSQEYGSRVLTQHLLWTRVPVRTPAPCERWSRLVAVVWNPLALARQLGHVLHRPWERSDRPVTPPQGRRRMPTIVVPLGTPARACHPRGPSPGRANGFRPPPAARFPVVWKTLNEPLTPSG